MKVAAVPMIAHEMEKKSSDIIYLIVGLFIYLLWIVDFNSPMSSSGKQGLEF